MYDKKKMECFANTIAKLLEERNIKQRDLAKKMNIAPPNITRMKSNPLGVCIDQLADMANALDVDIDVLLGIDRANDFIVNFVQEFTRITTTNEFSANNDGVYNVDNAVFECKEDYLVLTGNKSLFTLIKEVADIENIKNDKKKNLCSFDYNESIKNAKEKYEKDRIKYEEKNYYLITGEQMQEIIDHRASNQAYIEQLFIKLGITSPLEE